MTPDSIARTISANRAAHAARRATLGEEPPEDILSRDELEQPRPDDHRDSECYDADEAAHIAACARNHHRP